MNATNPTTGTPKPSPDKFEIIRAFNVIVQPDQIVELRAFKTSDGTRCGFYDGTALIDDTCALSELETTPNTYWTLQSVKRELFDRQTIRKNNCVGGTKNGECTGDSDIDRCVWIPLDFDPERPEKSKSNSSNSEKQASFTLATVVRGYLLERGISTVLADSGNGTHLLIRVHFTADSENTAFAKEILDLLNRKFGNDAVTIDTALYNPSRILKAYGTVTRKGPHSDERPWRVSKVLDVPANFGPTAIDTLRSLVAELRKEFPPVTTTSSKSETFGPKEIILDPTKRNVSLTSLAGRLRHEGLSANEIEERLTEENLRAFADPLPADEIHTISQSIGKRPTGAEKRAAEGTAFLASSRKVEPTPEGGSSLMLVRASDIKPESQKWLWLNRIPADTITGLVGEPDKGKSLVTNDIAARLTTGQPFPDGAPNPFGGPVEVLMLVAEDSLKSTAVPRLIQAGADLTKIHFLDSVLLNQGGTKIKKHLALDTDLPAIRATLLANPNIRLVIVDTVTSYTGNANQYKDSEMRKILLPFRDLAEEAGVTLVTIAHFNKNDKSSAMNRTGGSIAITAIPRAVWCCVADPEQDDRQLFLRVKGNLGKKLHGLSYTIEEAFIDIGELKPASVPNLVWGKEPVERGADDVLVTSADPQERGVGKAEKFLKEFLADGKPHLSQRVFDVARESGISEIAIKRARGRLHVQSRNLLMQWWCRLPNEHNHDNKDPWVMENQAAQAA